MRLGSNVFIVSSNSLKTNGDKPFLEPMRIKTYDAYIMKLSREPVCVEIYVVWAYGSFRVIQ